MKKVLITISSIVAVFIILIIVADAYAPKRIDWRPSYSTLDKIPLGLYVFNREATTLFKGGKISRFSQSPYEYFDALYDYDIEDYRKKGTYLKIKYVNLIDGESANELLSYADYGNTVVISAANFPFKILDTLGLQVTDHNPIPKLETYTADAPEKRYTIETGLSYAYFDKLTTSNDSITILGYQKANDTIVPNFIEARFGRGRIILHTQPAAFTNYYLLNGNNYEYAEAVVSKIPNGDILWQTGEATFEDERSTLSYFLEQPAFRVFWYMGIWALIVFIFFNARRRQRIVPTINPVTNTTVDFAKTIGNLYYQEGNHHTIIEKKIIYFLEHIRNEYLIDTYELDDAFAEKLHQKTGRPIDDINKAIRLIKKHRHDFQSTEADVIAINNAIEKLRL